MIIISIALIKSRIENAQKIVNTLLRASLKPDKIFFFISEEPFNMDKGIKPEEVPIIDDPRVEFIYTENIGSLRKIVPILKMYWNKKDTKIIVCDDDRIIRFDTIKKLVDYSNGMNHSSHACATAGNVWEGDVLEYVKKGVIYKYANSSHMPTGTGVVLGWAIIEPIQVDLLNSGMMMLIKPEFFPDDILHWEEYVEKFGVNRTDEYFLSYLLAKKGTKRFVIPINTYIGQYVVEKELYLFKDTREYKNIQFDEFAEKMKER